MMMAITIPEALLVGVVSVLALAFLWRNFVLPSSRRLPPGPRPLPIVGNLLMVRKFGSLQDFANELRRKYGPIATFWFGSQAIVIISGPAILQEAMITKGGLFNARNQLPSVRLLMCGHRGLTTVHGERHRFLRKLVMTEILSKKRVAGFRPIRDREVNVLVENLTKQQPQQQQKNSQGGGEYIVTDFRSLIRLGICNMLMGVLFGRTISAEEFEVLDVVMVRRFLMSLGKPRDFIPLLAWLPDWKGDELQLELKETMSRILETFIEERRQALKKSGTASDEAPFVDTVLGLQSGGGDGDGERAPVEILDSDIVLLCLDFLNAGTDTSVLNVEYGIANLINQPRIQETLAQEIAAVAGDRVVCEEDLPRLPYLEAVVKEALRRHTPARVAPSRKALSATKLAGYDIPANTVVLQHLEAVALSPQIWEDPLEFRPERFLNKTVDITGSTEISMVPFGMGRRICPAINIAFLHAQLILARLIQTFEWKSANPPGQLLDLSPGAGLTGALKYRLAAILQERSMAC